MEPIGYQGIFKQGMVNAFSAMQDNKNIIIDFCDVFIDDPLMEWIWKCKKEIPSVSLGGDNISMTISQEPPERKYIRRESSTSRKNSWGSILGEFLWKNFMTLSIDKRNFLMSSRRQFGRVQRLKYREEKVFWKQMRLPTS
jgi:phosphatidylinositol kinase/protein kinase (PI-3  family)